MSSLLSQCEMISLESESGLASAAQAAKRLPHYFDSVKSYMAKSVLDPILDLFTTTDADWYSKGLNKQAYIDLQDVEVACPMGFTGDYVKYLKVLTEAAEAASLVLNRNVAPFNEWLEAKLGDPLTLSAVMGARVQGYTDLNCSDHWHRVNAFFTKQSREFATTKYKNLVRRNADWIDIVKGVKFLETNLNDVYHKSVMEHTNRLAQNLDTLLHRIEQDPVTYQLSGAVVKTLAERSYECAKAVEFYALIRFKMRELESALHDTKAKIQSIV
jgi:hypothetical protein